MAADSGVLQRAALWYARRGWPVLPAWWPEGGRCACGASRCKPAKHPIGALVPHGHLNATADASIIEAWWSRYPKANIGLPAIPFCVLDIDPEENGTETLYGLTRQYGELPDRPTAQTGGGGRHYYFEPVPGLTNWQKRPDLPGIDFRAGGNGYVIAPPSLHVSGRRYDWEAGNAPHEIALAPLPSWLRNLAAGRKADGEERPARTPSEWAAMVAEPLTDGRRHPALVSLAALLAARLVPYDVGRELLLGFNARSCSPPKDEREILKLAEWAWRKEQSRADVRTQQHRHDEDFAAFLARLKGRQEDDERKRN